MKDKIEEQLENIKLHIPKINSNLQHQIYDFASTSINAKPKRSFSFFTKSFKIALTSLVIGVVITIGFILYGYSISNDSNMSNDQSNVPSFVPNNDKICLSCEQAILTEEYDIVTICVKNKVNNLSMILLKEQSNLLDVKLNNGDAIVENINDSQEGFFVNVYNYNTKYHYFDLYYPKNTFNDENNIVDFFITFSGINSNLKYEYQLILNNVIMQRNGN